MFPPFGRPLEARRGRDEVLLVVPIACVGVANVLPDNATV